MKQKSRWSDAQLTVLKGALADNEVAITAIRKVLLDDELTTAEQKVLKTSIQSNEKLKPLIRRHYCPTLVVDAPIGQVQDRLIALPLDTMTPDMATLQADATERAEDCLKENVEKLLCGTDAAPFKELYKLDRNDPEGTYTGLLARNKYVVDAEKLTHHLYLLAGTKTETAEETMKRLQQDGSK